MLGKRNLVAILAAGLNVPTLAFTQTGQYGTAEEARAMLEKAVAAVKADNHQPPTRALDMFNRGEGGFRDRDLQVLCANALDGVVTANATHKGARLEDLKDVKGFTIEFNVNEKGEVTGLTSVQPNGRFKAEKKK